VRTRPYGRVFLESLPPCRVASDRQELSRFLSGEVPTAAW
jgi:hypothetical protein